MHSGPRMRREIAQLKGDDVAILGSRIHCDYL